MDARVPPDHDLDDYASPSAGAESGGIDVDRLQAVFQRRLRLMIAVAIVVFSVVALLTLEATPKYTAKAEVMLDRHQQKVVDAQEVLSGLPPDSNAVDTEVQVIRSHALARRVVDALNLQTDPDFNPRLRPPGLFSRSAPESAPTNMAGIEREKERATDILLGGLKVARAGVTYVIDISYTSKSSRKAAILANAFADQYLNDQLETKFEATKRASDWLNSKLTGLRSQAESSDAAVQAYKSANGLLSSEGNTITEQSISGLSEQIAQAKAAEAEVTARVSTARAQLAHGSNGEDVGEALSSPVVSQLRAQRAEVSRQVADLEGRYGPRHPDLLKAKRQLSDIDGQITAEIQRIISGLEAQEQVARQRTASLQASLAASKGTLSSNNNASVRLNELERDADSVKTLYQSYLDRFKQTTAQQGIEETDARILSRAETPPRPSFPNVPLTLALGVLLGIAAAVAAATIAELLDRGLASGDDVERELGVPSLVGIPHLLSVTDLKGRQRSIRPTDFIVEKPLSRFAEAFRTLRTSIVYSNLDRKIQVISVASAVPGEGKSTTCAALARTSALAGGAVVAVDCDLRRRSLHKLFDLEPELGLLDVLTGAATLDQALVLDQASGAYILPLTTAPFTPKDVFGSEAMDNLLRQLRARFDFILLDTPPVLAVADAAVICAKADAVVFITRWRKTSRRFVEQSLRVLSGVGAYVSGVSLTQVDAKQQARSGYADAAYYYKQYRGYYSE
jgi:exopolysaccharide transport family protein